jgi:hypothetical protein
VYDINNKEKKKQREVIKHMKIVTTSKEKKGDKIREKKNSLKVGYEKRGKMTIFGGPWEGIKKICNEEFKLTSTTKSIINKRKGNLYKGQRGKKES